MYTKKLVSALVIGILATTSLPALADGDWWTDVANVNMMKKDMKTMHQAMDMMAKAEKMKDKEMAMKAIEMMKQYISDYEKIFGEK